MANIYGTFPCTVYVFFVEVLYGKKLGEELTDFESCTEEEA